MEKSLWSTLLGLRGNARGAVYVEPLWGIPFNLYAPYISIYMLALGLRDSQVGLVTSVSLAGQIVFAALSGIITDKLGRKRATLIFDVLSWSVPCLLWAVAHDLTWFLVAALVNSMRRVPDNSWTCLLVEDTDPRELVHIYAWVYIAGQLSVFFAPIAGLLIQHYSLVPTVRGLYVFAFVLMTTKFLTLNAMVTETNQGRARMKETRSRSVLSLLGEYRAVARQVLHTPETLYTIALMAIVSIVTIVQSTFWSIIVTERIHIPAAHIALYPFARSGIMLLCLFVVVPRMQGLHFARPMWVALGGFLASQIILVTVPDRGYGLLLLSTVLESCSYAVLGTQTDRLTVINVDPQERARIVSIAHVAVLASTTPFGWIAGLLSQANRTLPFVLNMGMVLLGMWVVSRLSRTGSDRTTELPQHAQSPA